MTIARRRSYVPSQATWEAFLRAWWESYAEEPQPLLAGLAVAPKEMQAALWQDDSSTRSAISLGLLVRRHLLNKTTGGNGYDARCLVTKT